MTFWEKQNYKDRKKISGCQRFREREREGGVSEAKGIFQGGETILYDTIVVDT